MYHAPVLCEEAVAFLNISGSRTYVDGTVGGGGHAEKICERLAGDGRVICVDRDAQAIAAARERLAAFGARVTFVHAPFATLAAELEALNIGRVAGVLLDLGVSSRQLDDGSRGFTFRADAPLDMRMDDRQGLSAMEVVNSYEQSRLADVIWRFGEERHSRRLAREICRRRPVRTTGALREAVAAAVGGAFAVKSLARVFQAIRIEVNGELDQLEGLLSATPALLAEGGRLVVISYHSLEDRIVKEFMRRESTPAPGRALLPVTPGPVRFKLVTRKAVVPEPREVEQNPRAEERKDAGGGTDRPRTAARMNDLLEYAKKTSAPAAARGAKNRRREPAATQRSSPVRGNKRAAGKRLSTFNIVIAVFAAGVAIVVYVNNILAVNQLAFEVNRLEIRADSLSNINNVLRAAVNRKTALEQIGRIATGELQLQYLPPGEQPVLLELDPEKVERLRQEEPRR